MAGSIFVFVVLLVRHIQNRIIQIGISVIGSSAAAVTAMRLAYGWLRP